MSIDLAFWKYRDGKYLDNKEVYLKACWDGEEMAELEPLPIKKILKKLAETFSNWNCLDKNNDEKEEGDAFVFAKLILVNMRVTTETIF